MATSAALPALIPNWLSTAAPWKKPTSAPVGQRLGFAAPADCASGGRAEAQETHIGDTATFPSLSALAMKIGGASRAIRFVLKRTSDAFDSSNRHRERDVIADQIVFFFALYGGVRLLYDIESWWRSRRA